jgi:hypothetical protein
VVQGLARLIGSAQTPGIRGLIAPWLAAFQDVENALWEVVTLRYLDTAEGVQLDMLGAILGAPRGNLTDALYLIRLKAQIVILRAEGVPPQLEQLLILCCPYAFTFTEVRNATLIVELVDTVDPDAFDVSVLFGVLEEAKAAGVRFELVYSLDEDDFLFAEYDSGGYTSAVYDPAHGLGEYPTTYGGRLAAVQVTA